MLKRGSILVCALAMLLLSAGGAQADAVCFARDIPSTEGLWLVSVPQPGKLMLGDRQLQPGDIITREQGERMLFYPEEVEYAAQTALVYLPLGENGIGSPVEIAVTVQGRLNQAPVAEDFALETYENLSIPGKFKASDPEGEELSFTIVRQSRRGITTLEEDGSFTYTPKKGKVGIDSFTYVATDASGKPSREATVTISILKANAKETYADTLGDPCRFAAEWMKNTGIFTGEQISGKSCFDPEQSVSRGQFIAMLVQTLQLPAPEQSWVPEGDRPVAAWLRPYLAAAHRAGLTAGLRPDSPLEEAISQAEAEAMVSIALDFPESSSPAWACFGEAPGSAPLTRSQAAQLLYDAYQLFDIAPGMRIIRSAQRT